jgi:hypothetical protein
MPVATPVPIADECHRRETLEQFLAQRSEHDFWLSEDARARDHAKWVDAELERLGGADRVVELAAEATAPVLTALAKHDYAALAKLVHPRGLCVMAAKGGRLPQDDGRGARAVRHEPAQRIVGIRHRRDESPEADLRPGHGVDLVRSRLRRRAAEGELLSRARPRATTRGWVGVGRHAREVLLCARPLTGLSRTLGQAAKYIFRLSLPVS